MRKFRWIFFFGILGIAAIALAATYTGDTTVNLLTDVGSTLTSSTAVPVQDPSATATIGRATIQEIVDKGLESPGAIGGTTPAAGAFTTLDAGSGGFSVDADGDVEAKSLTIEGNSIGPQGMTLLEDADNGNNYVGIASPASNDNNLLLALPTSDPAADSFLLFGVPSSVTYSDGSAMDTSQATWGSFDADDFDLTSGVLSIDYTNGQAASGTTKGLLTSTDWTTFNNKADTANETFTGETLSNRPHNLNEMFIASFNPQDVYDNDSTNHALTLCPYVGAAFTVTRIYVVCDAAPTTEPQISIKTTAAGVGYGTTPTTVHAVTTSSGVANITTITAPSIASGNKIYLTIDADPDDTINEISVLVEGDWN